MPLGGWSPSVQRETFSRGGRQSATSTIDALSSACLDAGTRWLPVRAVAGGPSWQTAASLWSRDCSSIWPPSSGGVGSSVGGAGGRTAAAEGRGVDFLGVVARFCKPGGGDAAIEDGGQACLSFEEIEGFPKANLWRRCGLRGCVGARGVRVGRAQACGPAVRTEFADAVFAARAAAVFRVSVVCFGVAAGWCRSDSAGSATDRAQFHADPSCAGPSEEERGRACAEAYKA